MSSASYRRLQARHRTSPSDWRTGSQRSPRMRGTRETRSLRLTGRIARRLSTCGVALVERDRFDLDPGVFRQRGNTDRRTRRRVLSEVGRVDFVHLLEVAEVSQEYRCFHDICQRELFRLQNRGHAVEDAFGLLRNVFGNDLAGFRIERDLPRTKDE